MFAVCNGINLFIALALLALSVLKMMATPGDRRWELLCIASATMIVSASVTGTFLDWSGHHFTERFDLYAYHLDKLFGQPSFMVGRFLFKHPWLFQVTACVYYLIFAVVFGTVGWYFITQPLEDAKAVARTFLIVPIAQLIYLVFPASGPGYAFHGSYPWRIPEVSPHTVYMTAPPNCMPSVHLSLALLVLYFLRRWDFGFLFGIGLVLMVELATLGTGEHYLIDLIAAVPFTGLLVYLGGWTPKNAIISTESTGFSQSMEEINAQSDAR